MTGARILRDVTLADYRADEIGDGPPNLSQSIASILLAQSPLHAHQAHPKLGGGRDEEPTPEQDMGTLIPGPVARGPLDSGGAIALP